MITSERASLAILTCLVLGSLALAIKNTDLSSKFLDLTSTGLGGFLALSIQKKQPVNNLPQSE